MNFFVKNYKPTHYLPTLLVWVVFGLFFWLFLSTANGTPLATSQATASLLPFDATTKNIAASPEYSPYRSFFVPKLLFTPYITTPTLLGHEQGVRIQAMSDLSLDPAWLDLIARLESDGFAIDELLVLFSRLGSDSYSPFFMSAKVRELYGIGGVADNTAYSAEQLIPSDYAQPISSITIGECLIFAQNNKEHFTAIQKKYGVPKDVILSILLVETSFGNNLGKYSAVHSLASLAATDTPTMLASKGETRQTRGIHNNTLSRTLSSKSAWAYDELKALLSFGNENSIDVVKMPSSIYGAVGLCQFMPSNIPLYGIDGDNDGIIDLFNPIDAIYSVANYLALNGWNSKNSQPSKLKTIYSYNHSYVYANNVLAVAKQIEQGEKGKVAKSRNPLASISWSPASGKAGSNQDKYLAKRIRGGAQIAPIVGLSSYSSIFE